MDSHYTKIKDFISQLDLTISHEQPDDGILVVQDETNGVRDLVIDCEDPILILEQPIFKMTTDHDIQGKIATRLLQMNRGLVHGAFAMSDDSGTVIFRDTLQLATLDFEELESSINALSLGLAEFSDEIIEFATHAQEASA